MPLSSTESVRHHETQAAAFHDVFAELAMDVDLLRLRLQPVLEQYLASIEGDSLGSLEAHQAFAKGVQTIADRLGLQIACGSCGKKARLNCAPVPTVPLGAFQFRHSKGQGVGYTHGAGSKIPRIRFLDE